MTMPDGLPNPEKPTYHPGLKENRHPAVNVFDLMPVHALGSVGISDCLQVNIATFVDPASEMDYHRLVASRPRWVHGLTVRVDALDRGARRQSRRAFPSDALFTGTVLNHDANKRVVGVMHPNISSWLAFEPDAFGDRTLETIADFKAEIGHITTYEQAGHNATLRMCGKFTVRGAEMT